MNYLELLSEEDKNIFYEFGGMDTQLIYVAPIILVINLIKKLRAKGVV